MGLTSNDDIIAVNVLDIVIIILLILDLSFITVAT